MSANEADERQPLLVADPGPAPQQRGEEDTNIVRFDPDGDLENPMEWPAAFKWSVVALLCCMAFTVTFTCISVVPLASRIVDDLDGDDDGGDKSASSVLLVTIWELGEAAGPLLIAPLSEVLGRYPVMNGANALFVAATCLAALSSSTPLFIAARALTGLAVASNVLNPAIVGDMFPSDRRGSALSLVMLAPLIGGAVGPAIAGAVAESLGWRRVLWIAAGLAGTCELLFLTCFRETYKVRILRRRAARLRAESGNTLLRTEFDEEEDKKSDARKLWDSIMRPAVVLCGSGVLLALSLYGSFVFAYFYIMAVTLPDILETMYGLSPALMGSSFMAFSVGSFVSIIICNTQLDAIYTKLRNANNGIGLPEHRLPLVIIGAFTLPLAVVAYGWIAELALPLPVLLLSVAMMGTTLLLAFMPIMAYVVDAFGLYSASAMTGVIVLRCLMGTFLPLTTGPLIANLDYGGAVTALGLLSLFMAPIPVLIMRYGQVWRQRSPYTRDEE